MRRFWVVSAVVAVMACAMAVLCAGATSALAAPYFSYNPGTLAFGFEDGSSGWVGDWDSEVSDDAVHVKSGNHALRITIPGDPEVGWGGAAYRNNLDLSISGDCVQLWAYLYSGADGATPCSIDLFLSNDAVISGIDYVPDSFQTSYVVMHEGWNLLRFSRADFRVAYGSPSWGMPFRSIAIALNENGTYMGPGSYCTVDDLRDGTSSSPPAWIWSFDDGYDSVWSQALPYMTSLGQHGTMYIIPSIVGEGGTYITKAHLDDLYAQGWAIGNHADGDDISQLSVPHAQALIEDTDAWLVQNGYTGPHGDGHKHFAYPLGYWSNNARQALANAGMLTARIVFSERRQATPLDEPLLLASYDYPNRTLDFYKGIIDKLIATGGAINYNVHRVAPDDMPVATFRGICDYLNQKGVWCPSIDEWWHSGDPIMTTVSGLVATPDESWTQAPQQVALSAAGGSGTLVSHYQVGAGDWTVYDEPFVVAGEGSHRVDYYSEGAGGNTEATQTGYVNVDETAPATTAEGLAADDHSAWRQSAQTVSLAASDALSGVDHISYSVDGGDAVTYGEPFAVGDEGSHTVSYAAVDAAGNVEATQTGYVNIDTTPPQTQASAQPGVWYAVPLQVDLSATDAASGVATTEYSLDGGATWQAGTSLALTARWKRGGGSGVYPVTMRSTDVAGNSETPTTVAVLIDTTAPTASDDAPTTPQSSPVTVHFTGQDPYAGVSTFWYSVDDGPWTQGGSVTIDGPADHSNDGLHTIRYYAIDDAGNLQVGYNVCAVTIDTSSLGAAVLPAGSGTVLTAQSPAAVRAASLRGAAVAKARRALWLHLRSHRR